MYRFFTVATCLLATSFTGCVGWGPGGNEQFVGPVRGTMRAVVGGGCGSHCNNCDGYNPPFGSVRKTLACGSGCGEIYYGEWLSNPPNGCNECDVRGAAYGHNTRLPWLSSPWLPWGVKYRPNGEGYGNPLRGQHVGVAQYGGYRGTILNRGSLIDGGCATCNDCGGGSAPTLGPVDGKLNPIPQKQPAPQVLPKPKPKTTTGKQVNYVSPLLKHRTGRLGTSPSLRTNNSRR